MLLIGLIAASGAAVFFQEQTSGLNHITTVTATTTTAAIESPLTFNYSSLPSEFTIGNYTITVWQHTGSYPLIAADRTWTYKGFFTAFTIFWIRGTAADSQTVPFFWNSTSGPSTAHPPYNAWCFETSAQSSSCPYTATALSGHVNITWTKLGSTIWVSFIFESSF